MTIERAKALIKELRKRTTARGCSEAEAEAAIRKAAGFHDKDILAMGHRSALAFWRAHKEALLALCESHAPEQSEAAAEDSQ